MFGLFGTFGVIDWPAVMEGQKYAKINTATQQKLKDLGFDPGTIDGLLGNQTKAAVAKFEKSWGLPADESWADFLDSLDIAYRGRPTTSAPAVPAAAAVSKVPAAPAPLQSEIMTAAARGKPSVLSKFNFRDPKVIVAAGVLGLGIVIFLAPKSSGGRKSVSARRRRR